MSLWRLKKKKSFIVPSLFLMSFWPHIIFGSPTDLWSSLTFEICMWPHLAMNSGKSMWKTLLHSCKTEIIRQINYRKKTCGKNVSFLFFFLSFHKTDLKVLYRDWHSSRSLVTIAICVQGHRMLVSNRLLPKTVWEKKLSDFKSLEVCNSFYIFQAV